MLTPLSRTEVTGTGVVPIQTIQHVTPTVGANANTPW